MKEFDSLNPDDLYTLYNALCYHRNHLAVLINHETEDINLLRSYKHSIARLNYLISIFSEVIT